MCLAGFSILRFLTTAVLTLSILSVVPGCHSAKFVYLELVSDNVSVVEVEGRPAHKPYFGPLVPSRYRYDSKSFDLTFSIGSQSFIPDLIIDSSLPILDIQSKECVFTHTRSRYQSALNWGYWPDQKNACVILGEAVSIEVMLDGVDEPIEIKGVVRNGGSFVFSDF